MAHELDIRLAGYNVDADSIAEINKIVRSKDFSDNNYQRLIFLLDTLTPETISAAYARISRSPKTIPELRKQSVEDIAESRKTNKTVIFGMGHKSVAEHSQFNFDVMNVSRLAVEKIEEKRLCGYTEKSQRYVTLDGDFLVPKEIIQAGPKIAERFIDLVTNVQNKFYFDNLKALQEWHAKQDYHELFAALGIFDKKDRQAATIEGLGKEDARYTLPMATLAQLGMTISARNLEVLITSLRSSNVAEFQDIGEALFKPVDGFAPSVIKYTEPTDYFAKTRPELKSLIEEIIWAHEEQISKFSINESKNSGEKNVLILNGLDVDSSIIAGLIFSSSSLSYQTAYFLAEQLLGPSEQKRIFDKSVKYKTKHDPMLREYELGDRVAEITLSSSAFAQLKRHRMNTLIAQDYDPTLGFTVPESIIAIGKEKEFEEIMGMTNEFYYDLKGNPKTANVADYILTNAHRRRVLLDANNRQVYAIAMERENLPAQWDIRRIIKEYVAEMKKTNRTLELACGKHDYDKVKARILANG